MPNPRITIEPGKMDGAPCIRGSRIPVVTVVRMVAQGLTTDEILELYPGLEREDIAASLSYAADAVDALKGNTSVVPASDPVGEIIRSAQENSGLSEDEAQELANEETRAVRRERAARTNRS